MMSSLYVKESPQNTGIAALSKTISSYLQFTLNQEDKQ